MPITEFTVYFPSMYVGMGSTFCIKRISNVILCIGLGLGKIFFNMYFSCSIPYILYLEKNFSHLHMYRGINIILWYLSTYFLIA